MRERVAIVAAAQTKFEPHKDKQRMQEIVWEVVSHVVKQTGLHFEEEMGIDNAVTCSDDFFDARTISDGAITDVVGSHMRSEEKVSMDSLMAVYYAWAGILSGHYDITLVVAHSKESQAMSRNLITNAAFDPIYQRPLGIDYLQACALQARAYMNSYKISKEIFAKVVVKSRQNASKNPFAQEKKKVTCDQVLKSPMVADPLSKLDIYPVSDGACAMILATESKAKLITDKPVWILGGGCCYDNFYLGDRNLARSDALRKAAGRAYQMAGIKQPSRQLSLAEISAYYSYQEPLWCEGLGLCPDGKGGIFTESGESSLDGKMPVNPSGGPLTGNPQMVGGIVRAAECFLQLRGEAGKRQVKNAKRALAHGTIGPAGQFHAVMIFGVEN